MKANLPGERVNRFIRSPDNMPTKSKHITADKGYSDLTSAYTRSIDRVKHLDDRRQRVTEYSRSDEIDALDRSRYGDRVIKSRPINGEASPYSNVSATHKDRTHTDINNNVRKDFARQYDIHPNIKPTTPKYVASRIDTKCHVDNGVKSAFVGCMTVALHNGLDFGVSAQKAWNAVYQYTGKRETLNSGKARLDPSSRIPGSSGARNKNRSFDRTSRSINRADTLADSAEVMRGKVRSIDSKVYRDLSNELQYLKGKSAQSNKNKKELRSQIYGIRKALAQIK